MIEIIEFTDPVCTWCWGSEPILRKIETKYKGLVKIGFIMGGLVENMEDFRDEENGIGGEISEVNKQIADHWMEASRRHGMPVKTEGFSFFTKDHVSTYPTNIAYKAAQFQGEEIANRYLRRIREAVAAEAKQANQIEVLQQLAKEVGLDEEKWLEYMNNGLAKLEFEKDLQLCRQFQIYAFPSYLVRNEEGKGMLLRGFQTYETFLQAIKQLSHTEIKEQQQFSKESIRKNIETLIEEYETITLMELATILDCSKEEVEPIIKELLAEGLIEKKDAGNGYLLKYKK